MKTRNGIRADINALYRSKIISWLEAQVRGQQPGDFPIRIYLGAPAGEDEVAAVKRQFLEFCADWHQELPAGHVDFLEKRFSQIGTIEVPVHLVFERVEDLASWAGHLVEYYSAVNRLAVIRREMPDLIEAALDCVGFLTSFEDKDFYKFVDVCKWLCTHSDSNVMIRQIPIRGVDAAWFEEHRGMILRFLRDYLELDPKRRDLRQLGLVPAAPLIRVIVLDHVLRGRVGGMRYFAATVEDLAVLDIKPQKVIFFEDLSTAMAVPDIAGAVIIVTPTSHLARLCRIEWISLARCSFFGGIETRSFAMLNNLRVYLPNTESRLMDVETLISNRDLWTFDDVDPASDAALAALTGEEANLYQLLLSGAFGAHVRLPQERLPLRLIYKYLGLDDSLLEEAESSAQNALAPLKPMFESTPAPLSSGPAAGLALAPDDAPGDSEGARNHAG